MKKNTKKVPEMMAGDTRFYNGSLYKACTSLDKDRPCHDCEFNPVKSVLDDDIGFAMFNPATMCAKYWDVLGDCHYNGRSRIHFEKDAETKGCEKCIFNLLQYRIEDG